MKPKDVQIVVDGTVHQLVQVPASSACYGCSLVQYCTNIKDFLCKAFYPTQDYLQFREVKNE